MYFKYELKAIIWPFAYAETKKINKRKLLPS